MINKKRLLNILKDTVSVDTQNPPGNERDLAQRLKKYLKKFGITASIKEFYPRRSNLVFRLKSKKGKKTLVVSPHLDTVPADSPLWNTDPLKLKLKKGKAIGRGTSDCKGNLAALLEALIALRQDKILENLDIVFCATADEETGSHQGLIPLLKHKSVKGDFWLVLDSDGFDIVVCQKGLLHLSIGVQGQAAHASVPHLGRNAIHEACRAIEGLYSKKFKYKKNPLLAAPTVNVGTIKGGVKTNVVSPSCSFTLDIRYLPGMKYGDIMKDVKKVLKKHCKKFKLRVDAHQMPVSIEPQNFWIDSLRAVLKKKKVPSRLKGSEGATVMRILKDYGINSFSFGFGKGGQAHKDNEYAVFADIYKGAGVLYEYFVYLDRTIR